MPPPHLASNQQAPEHAELQLLRRNPQYLTAETKAQIRRITLVAMPLPVAESHIAGELKRYAILAAAILAAHSVITCRHILSCQMRVRLTEKPKMEDDKTLVTTRGPAKPRYKNGHLPFENQAQDLETWRNTVLPAVIDWAGTLEDPFGANSHLDLHDIVRDSWNDGFPGTPPNDAVHSVVSQLYMVFQQLNMSLVLSG